MEEWLKRLWLVVGVLVLPLLVYALYSAIKDMTGPDWVEPTVGLPSDTTARTAPARAVRATLLDPIIGSRHRLLTIHYGEAQVYEEFGLTGSPRRRFDPGAQGAVVNIAFLDPNGAISLLFDRAAFIRTYDYPDESADSAQKWIFYELASADTDQDGQLGSEDELTLYVTDLTGGNLRRASPESMDYKSYEWIDPAGVVLITGLERPRSPQEAEPSKRPQRFVFFDARSGQYQPAAALDSIVSKAGSILRR